MATAAFRIAQPTRLIPTILPLPRLRPVPEPALRPLMSVVIVNFCQWRNTARLVRQLRACPSVRAGRAEIVVVDNHSPIHPALQRLRRTPGVSLRRMDRNRGFASAVNEGCRLAEGKWLLLLNPDMSVPRGFLDRALQLAELALQRDPKTGVVGFQLHHTDGSIQASHGAFPSLISTLGGLLLPRARRKCRVSRGRGPRRVQWVTGCCLLTRRECLERLGGFDETFFLYYEDVDFCRRARQAGFRVWFEPKLQLTHHTPLHARSVPSSLRLMTRHALLTYARKHWPAWQQTLLGGIVWLEAWVRERYARWRGQSGDAQQFAQLRRLTMAVLQRADDAVARCIRRTARHLGAHAHAQDGKSR